MAKYRHRIFEMYEFRDEATRALTPKSARSVMEAVAADWTFVHLAVSRSETVTHVHFNGAQAFEEETAQDLRADFSQLANGLVRDSKVLLDFVGVNSFCAAAIDELILFNQKLRTKGSRLALCCLDPTVHQSFFLESATETSNKHEFSGY